MVMPGLTALIFALLLALVFSLFLRRTGPWGGFTWFFLLVFLGAWAVGSWARPVGPVWGGVAWVPFLVGALAIALLLAAVAGPDERTVVAGAESARPEAEAAEAVGFFFWFLVLLLAVLIVMAAFA